MNELGIWTLQADGTAEAVNAVSRMDLEERLEDALVQRPDMLERDISLVGRQMPTEGGPADLLGVDARGQLVVFELKRGAPTRDAVTQCIDYASALDAMEPEKLAEHIAEHSGKLGIEKIDDQEFKEWYEDEFENELSDLLPPRLVLVGLGVDKRAERMARFLQASSVNISVLTFYAFQHGDETLLARQVEVEATNENDSQSRHSQKKTASKTARERQQSLSDHLSERELSDLFEDIIQTISTVLPGSSPRTGSWGVNFRLRFGRRLLRICHIWLRAAGIVVTLHATDETHNTDSLSDLVKRAEAAGWHRQSNKDAFAGITITDTEDWAEKRSVVTEFVKEAAALRRKAPATDAP